MTEPGAFQTAVITRDSGLRWPHALGGTSCVQSGSPAGTSQNASGGKGGVQGLSRCMDSQISSGKRPRGQNTARLSPETPGPKTLPLTCQHACQEARATGGPRAPLLRWVGKGAMGPPASLATERKGKEAHRALAWKRREQSPAISHCNPKWLCRPVLTVSGSKVRWAGPPAIVPLRPRPPSTAPGPDPAGPRPSRVPSPAQRPRACPRRVLPGDLAEPQAPDRRSPRGHPQPRTPNSLPECPPRPVPAPSNSLRARVR